MKRGCLIFFVALVLLANAFPSRALPFSSTSLHRGNIIRAKSSPASLSKAA